MIEIHTYKAQISGGKEIASVTLAFDTDIPDFPELDQLQDAFDREAVKIADLLCSTMPQGGLERLVAELLRRNASLLVIPLNNKTKGGSPQ